MDTCQRATHECMESVALQEMQVQFTELYSVDCKASAEKVLKGLRFSQHHFKRMEDLVNMGSACPCSWHSDAHCMVDAKEVELLVIGPPCSPFSGQRPKRFSDGCWGGECRAWWKQGFSPRASSRKSCIFDAFPDALFLSTSRVKVALLESVPPKHTHVRLTVACSERPCLLQGGCSMTVSRPWLPRFPGYGPQSLPAA